MANPKIDSIQFSGSTTKYDINLPTTATPSIAGLTVNGTINVNNSSDQLPGTISVPIIYGNTSSGLSLMNKPSTTDVANIALAANGGVTMSGDSVQISTNNNGITLDSADTVTLKSSISEVQVVLGANKLDFPVGKDGTIALMENFPAYTYIVRNEVSYGGSSGELAATLNGYINCKEYTNSGKKFCELINADLWVYLTNESAIGATYDITLRDIIGPVIYKAGIALNCNGTGWQDILYASLQSIEIYVKGTPKIGYCYIPLTKMGNIPLASNGKLIKIGEKIYNEMYSMDQYGNGLHKALSEYTESLSDIFDGISTTTSAAPSLSNLKMVSVTEENIDGGSISAGDINVLMHIILH